MQGEGAVVVAREELHAGRFERRDHQPGTARRSVGDLPECGGAVLLNLGVGREIFKGQDIVRGQAEDSFGGERSGELAGAEDGGVEGFGGLVVGDDDDAGSVRGADEGG